MLPVMVAAVGRLLLHGGRLHVARPTSATWRGSSRPLFVAVGRRDVRVPAGRDRPQHRLDPEPRLGARPRWPCARAGSVWLGAAAGVATGLAIGAINGVAVALLRFPAFVHTLGMLLTVRAVGMLMTGGHSVGRLPPAAIGVRAAATCWACRTCSGWPSPSTSRRRSCWPGACSAASCSWSAPTGVRRPSTASASRARASSPS